MYFKTGTNQASTRLTFSKLLNFFDWKFFFVLKAYLN